MTVNLKFPPAVNYVYLEIKNPECPSGTRPSVTKLGMFPLYTVTDYGSRLCMGQPTHLKRNTRLSLWRLTVFSELIET